MTAFESKIHLQSRAKCCNDARATAKFTPICGGNCVPSGLSKGELRQKSDIVSMIRLSVVQKPLTGFTWLAT
jgi:hypothetical protein